MSDLVVHIATTKLYRLKTAASAVRFFSADDSTTNAPSKYDFTPSSTVRFHEVRRPGSVCKCSLPSSQRRATAVYPRPRLHTVPLNTQCNTVLCCVAKTKHCVFFHLNSTVTPCLKRAYETGPRLLSPKTV